MTPNIDSYRVGTVPKPPLLMHPTMVAEVVWARVHLSEGSQSSDLKFAGCFADNTSAGSDELVRVARALSAQCEWRSS